MKHRNLRIAWSVAWGVLAILLVALWRGSYWRADTIFHQLPSSWGAAIGSDRGEVSVSVVYSPNWPMNTQQESWFYSIPYWYLLFLTPIAAAMPWMRWRFSLRTLLIATTLVAVVLWLSVAIKASKF